MFGLMNMFLSQKGEIPGEWKECPDVKSYNPFNNQIPASDKGKVSDTIKML